MQKQLYTEINLRLFDGAAGEGAGGEASAGAAESTGAAAGAPNQAPEVSVTTDAQDARRAEFERLIKGDYKDLFDERAQKIVNARFKQVKALEAQANQAKELAPVLDLLGSKYGVDGADVNALVKAIQEDDSYYEDEAMKKGVSVEYLKQMKRIERENAELKRAQQEQMNRANRERVYAEWHEQSEGCKAIYPGFDFRAEIEHPETGQRFARLLGSGVDVRTAFEVVHKDELIGGAMQYTAQTIQQKTVNDIRARGMRPAENGGGGNGAVAVTKPDPSKWSKKDRDAIARRVLKGERIEL